MSIHFKLSKRSLIALLASASLAFPLQTVQAQSYPSKPITILVGFGVGGAFDTVMRALAEEMSKTLGQPVNVDNKAGAGGAVATQALVNAPADGYTLLAAGLQLATGPHLNKVSYDPKTNLQMVRQVTSVPVMLLTHANSPIYNAADMAALAKKNGNGITIGTGGPGTTGHFGTFVITNGTNSPTVHVPFKGGAPALTALAGGEVDLVFDQPSSAMQGLIDAKKIRVVSLMQETTSSALPGIKSAKDIGLPLEVELRGWQGIAVKQGTPPEAVRRIDSAVAAAVASPAFKSRMEKLGIDVVSSSSPEAFQKHYLAEFDRWGSFITKYKIKPE
jgi:tripartite-type tricarboxylate transporter receptor subunit TctC